MWGRLRDCVVGKQTSMLMIFFYRRVGKNPSQLIKKFHPFALYLPLTNFYRNQNLNPPSVIGARIYESSPMMTMLCFVVGGKFASHILKVDFKSLKSSIDHPDMYL
jgi:hypothetical protein